MLFAALLAACPAPPNPDDTADTSDSAPGRCDEGVVGNICTWAGTPQAGLNGDGLDRRDSWLYFPIDVEFSPFGKPLVHDWNNHRLRVVEDDQTFRTVMGTSFVGDGPADLSDRDPPGAPGTSVNLNHPTDGVYLPDGGYLDASWHTHKLRHWDPLTGLVYVWAGDTPGYAGDGSTVDTALFNQPKAVAYDEASGSTYVVDMRNARVRCIDADGLVSTVAGDGVKGYLGDGEQATAAEFAFPSGTNPRPGGAIAIADGIIYIADTENHRIRALDLASGIVRTVAGTGTPGFSGDGAAATEAQLNYPMDIEVEEGILWIADTDNERIRAVDLSTGVITTVAGNGEIGDEGDGASALDASLFTPMGVELDLDGNLYIADSFNHRIRRVAR